MKNLKISYGTSRFSKRWTNTTTTWAELTERLATTHRTSETVAQYKRVSKPEQGEVKDVGGFVAGHLSGGRRKKGRVLERSIVTLDVDFAGEGFAERVAEELADTAYCLYSTHSHTDDNPRLRLLIPLSNAVKATAYEPLARKVAEQIGIDLFDDTTYEAHRLMYWPSTPSDGEYVYVNHEGAPLNPKRVMQAYSDWKDASTWPVSSRQLTAISRNAKKQADPLEKPGIIGAFCRAHTIEDAINTYLSDIYLPSTMEGRYDFIAGEAAAGLVLYEGKFAYSHHSTDPAGGQLLNAFDLVRVHLFGDQDPEGENDTTKLPSYRAMCDKAASDKAVKAELAAERRAVADDFGDESKGVAEHDPDAWQAELELKGKTGKPADTLPNLVLIAKNDKHLAGIAFNRHRDGIDVKEPDNLPWKQIKPGWSESDYSQLKNYLQEVYGLYSPTKTRDAVLVAAADRAYHPIIEWLEALPEWDGIERVNYLLSDYLGADDNSYTQAVIRKTLVAAVARLYQPGTKFDSVLILSGPQGCGKSTIFARLGGDWFSDSLTITDMKDKTGAEKLQGYWFLELGELAGMRKTDVETVKSFISRTDDKYRASYGISVESHPRQCVIVGTTNAESFLRDVTGNRRFWPVKVTGDGLMKPWELDSETVQQIWAEAVLMYRKGEKLYLSGEEAELAQAEQSGAMESDEREGIVRQFLETPVPAGWENWTRHQRNTWLQGEEFGGDSCDEVDLALRQEVCNLEIWCECFGREKASIKPQDSYAIASIMAKMEGWERASKTKRIGPYGMQRFYRRLPLTTGVTTSVTSEVVTP